MLENRFYIYAHRRMSDKQIFYVGKGSYGRSHSSRNRNVHWRNISNKHGFFVEIAFGGLSEKEAFRLEREAIEACRQFGCPLTNATIGGEGPSGAVRSLETRSRISNSRMGKVHSIAARLAQSRGQIGRKQPESMRQKVGAKLGKPVLCIETGKIYASASAAAREMALPRPSICKVCNRKLKSVGGFNFEWSKK